MIPVGSGRSALVGHGARSGFQECRVVDTWVDVQEPTSWRAPPSTPGTTPWWSPAAPPGYHVFVDMARAVQGSPHHRVAAALGPDHRLARVLARRLARPSTPPGKPRPGQRGEIVIVSAGSSDPRAGQDCERVAAMLSEVLGHPVSSAYLPRPPVPARCARGGPWPCKPAGTTRAGHPRDSLQPVRGACWSRTCWPPGSSTVGRWPRGPTSRPSRCVHPGKVPGLVSWWSSTTGRPPPSVIARRP
ncbi:hypothetical protein QJS66_07840 [Kocuria rhizophila]|nr:hypothetical protein QJS66_07840 [Kocuria rhizophila]